MSHTKGPWTALKLPVTKKSQDSDFLVYSEGASYEPSVARVENIEGGEGKANAKLIAAAPDLLEALEQALVAMCVQQEMMGCQHKMSIAINEARSAIQKAKGGKIK
jgi:hypothetical protein